MPCIFLFQVDWLVPADFSVENNLFYVEMVPDWVHIKHVKHICYISELHRKKTSFYKLNNSAWNVLVFKENQVKIKEHRLYSCFFVISLKFLIANWDALIPFLLVSFFCLKSKRKKKKISFQFLIFALWCRAPSDYQNC